MPALLLLLPLAGMIAGSPGCGSTVIQATGSSAAGGDGAGGSGAGTGPASASSGAASASSGPVASASSGGTGGGVTCSATEKVCDGKCVAVDDPAYGCTPTSCTACPSTPAPSLCISGTCVPYNCEPPFKNCDGNDTNGCETNIATDPANCGGCGAVCTVPHATASCTSGACGIAVCDSGWTDCNLDPTDGCEANLQNDPMNCGACGESCLGQSQCNGGSCSGYCDAKGLAICPGDPPGVCTVLGTNQNCNFCGDTCDLANATSQCQQDTTTPPPAPFFGCNLETCNAGFADCDMLAVNGCETNTDTDPSNCGACGNVCDLPNATSVCNAGQCQIATCNAGFQDCDHVASNGCEADTRNDWNNCGGCGLFCSGSPPGPNAVVCEGGVCIGWECVPGYANCDGNIANGCESYLATDPNNCHFCGNKCATTCSGGVCAP